MTAPVSFDVRLSFDSQTESAFSLEAACRMQGIYGLMGPSGAGKTSLLRTLAGLPVPAGLATHKQSTQTQRAAVTVGEESLGDLPTERRRIGIVFQEARLFPHLTVRGNLQFAAMRSAGISQNELADIAAGTGIDRLLDRRVGGLSGGERQRVALARALAYKPVLLLLDEPVSALDKQGRARLLAYLKNYLQQTGTPTLAVLHDFYDTSQIAGQILYMEQGRILAQDAPAAMSTRLDAGLPGTSILQARLLDFNADQNLLKVALGGSYLQITGEAGKVGDDVQLFVAARDVGLSLKPAPDPASFHSLAAGFDDALDMGADQVLVRLKLEDGQYLLAQISRYHFTQLQLKKDDRLYALIQHISLNSY